MSFQRIPRSLVDPKKHEKVGAHEIVLQWTDNPPSPCLSIYLGYNIARSIGIVSTAEKVQLLIGEGEDAGWIAVLKVSPPHGDYRAVAHFGSWRVYLPAHVSVEHFEFSGRTKIPADDVRLTGGMVAFRYAGLKR